MAADDACRGGRAAPPPEPPRPAWAAASKRLTGWSPVSLEGSTVADVLPAAGAGEAAAPAPAAAERDPVAPPRPDCCSCWTFSGIPWTELVALVICV